MILTGIGLFSLVSLEAAARRREYAIRIALGAPRQTIVGSMLVQALARVAPGMAAGGIVSLLAAPALTGMLFDVTSPTVMTFAAVAASMLMTTTLAALLPALAGIRTPPLALLNSE
jgi:ABC-type antimicrobial peptide transport system permease subunit